ncbi:outer membrane protein transport protein [Thermomonas sp.]|uniref:OmpP1/FadL family transporter n=1 Tax=Thermomonas sp. TaxID=1971895 RepID=UPI002CFE911D|nr:outer membrane protein transport protein [Thermomonas sp.]HRO62802.1 outer membrane protein transport protein [Thermomonas sp.]
MSNNRNLRASALALAVLGTLFVGQAAASGFQLREQSVKNLGRAGAGSGVAQRDAAVVSLNPAAMVNISQRTFQVDGTVIDLTAGFTGGGTALGAPGVLPNATLTGGNGGDPGDPTLVPNMSAVFPIASIDGLYLGASVGAPFGLKTDYAPGWVGRYRALSSEVKTVDLTLSAAYKVNDMFSIGVGLIYERAEATLSKSIDFGTAICAQAAAGLPAPNTGNVMLTCFNPGWALYPLYHPQSADGSLTVKGSDTDFGFLVGLQITPNEQFALGLSYRSRIHQKLQGTLDFNGVPAILGADPRFVDGPGGAKLVTPELITLSARYAFTDNFRMMLDIQHTGWNSLQDVTIVRNSGTVVGSEDFSWSGSTFVSLGGEYDFSDTFTLRFGVGSDETPTNDVTRTPRLPDNDRMVYALGASWHVSENLSLDAAYQRIEIKTPKIALPVDLPHSNTSTLYGSFGGHANLFGLSMQYRF